MLKKSTLLKSTLAALTVAVLSACGGSNAVSADGQIIGQPKFESLQQSHFTRGAGEQHGLVVPAGQSFNSVLGAVQKGAHKDAVMYGGATGLGRPHYDEGFGSRLLTYNLSKRTDTGWEHCQVKIGFDKNNRVGSVVDNPAGCAAEVTPQVPERVVEHPQTRRIEFGGAGAWFDFDRAVLKEQYAPDLRKLATALGQMDKIERVVVVGHTDQVGSAAYNQRLSEARAKAIANYLVANGAPASAMHVVGLGSSEPVKDCGSSRRTEEAKTCHSQNRRVEIYVNGSVEQLPPIPQ